MTDNQNYDKYISSWFQNYNNACNDDNGKAKMKNDDTYIDFSSWL